MALFRYILRGRYQHQRLFSSSATATTPATTTPATTAAQKPKRAIVKKTSSSSTATSTPPPLSSSSSSPSSSPQDVWIIDTKPKAVELKEALEAISASCTFSWRAEVADWSPGMSPVEKGNVIAGSLYVGGGNGGNGLPAQRIFIDNLVEGGDVLLPMMHQHLTDAAAGKIFHSSSFHVHQLERGLRAGGGGGGGAPSSGSSKSKQKGTKLISPPSHNIRGILGDTLRMAWLAGDHGLSLHSLTAKYCDPRHRVADIMQLFGEEEQTSSSPSSSSSSSRLVLPDVRSLQTDPTRRTSWILHSVRSAEATWHLYQRLSETLLGIRWRPETCLGTPPWQGDSSGSGSDTPSSSINSNKLRIDSKTMFGCYQGFVLPASEAIIGIERHGLTVNVSTVKQIQENVEKAIGGHSVTSKNEAETKLITPLPAQAAEVSPVLATVPYSVSEMSGNNNNNDDAFMPGGMIDFGAGFSSDSTTAFTQQPPPPPTATRSMTVSTKAGSPSSAAVSPTTASLLKDFLQTSVLPLLTNIHNSAGDTPTVVFHPSLNPNTANGSLMSSRPLLLDRSIAYNFHLPAAIQASSNPSSSSLLLVKVDNLELSILAHASRCSALLQLLEKHATTPTTTNTANGTIHEDTARDIFGTSSTASSLSSWQIQRAKDLNEGIPNGRTHFGFAKAWGCSESEAEQIVKKWFSARPGVWNWMEAISESVFSGGGGASGSSSAASAGGGGAKLAAMAGIRTGYAASASAGSRRAPASSSGASLSSSSSSGSASASSPSGTVRTLLGRTRILPPQVSSGWKSANLTQRHTAQRAAVAAYITGSAADVHQQILSRLHFEHEATGYKPVLAMFNEEILLEGGQKSGEMVTTTSVVAAMERVRSIALNPFGPQGTLHAPLLVRVGTGATWEEAEKSTAVKQK